MPPPRDLLRFSPAERWLHRSVAVLMSICLGTAAALYLDPVSALIGRRHLMATIHLTSGLLLPLPILIGLAAVPEFRADVRRLNRFLPGDWRWLRSAQRRDGSIPSGKFNAGQKLHAAYLLGAIIVMFVTGLMLHFFAPLPVSVRTGATFVHDLFATALVVSTAGHLWMASRDPEARRGMRTGEVTRSWAQQEHALWEAAEQGPAGREGDAPPT